MSNDDVEALLERMAEQGLPAQRGGFSVEAIPTGISSFDRSTGVDGVPRRRISLFEGREGSGKTLLLLVLIASAQKSGGRGAFVDLEHALTPSFANLLGVSWDDLVVSRPRTLNQAYDVAKEFAKSGLFDVVGFDSAVALATEDDIDEPASGTGQRASEAGLHSRELKKLISVIDPRTALVMINQIRVDPNPPPWWSAGPKEYTPGGRALRHHASLRVRIDKTKTYKNAQRQKVGHRIRTRIEKNKVSQPFREAEFDLRYDTGLDLVSDLVDTAVRAGVVKRASSWYTFDMADLETGDVIEEIKENGREAFERRVRDNPEAQENMRAQMLGRGDEGDNGEGWDAVDE